MNEEVAFRSEVSLTRTAPGPSKEFGRCRAEVLRGESKVRVVVGRESEVAANFVVDPRIAVVDVSEGTLGLSAFDYTSGHLVDTDLVFGFGSVDAATAFRRAFEAAQRTMASRIVDDLFGTAVLAGESLEEEVVRAAEALASRHCAGQPLVAKRVVLRMVRGTHPTATAGAARTLVETLRLFVDKLPDEVDAGDARQQQKPTPVMVKLRRSEEILRQLDLKIQEQQNATDLPEEVRHRKIEKYKFQQKLVVMMFKLYDKLKTPEEVTDKDVACATKLLEKIRAAGDSYRKIFEIETLRLVQRLEVARRHKQPPDSDGIVTLSDTNALFPSQTDPRALVTPDRHHNTFLAGATRLSSDDDDDKHHPSSPGDKWQSLNNGAFQ